MHYLFIIYLFIYSNYLFFFLFIDFIDWLLYLFIVCVFYWLIAFINRLNLIIYHLFSSVFFHLFFTINCPRVHVYPKWGMKSSSEKSSNGRLHGKSLLQIIFQRNWKYMEYNINHLLQLILIGSKCFVPHTLQNVQSQGNVYCYYNNVLLIPLPESPNDFATDVLLIIDWPMDIYDFCADWSISSMDTAVVSLSYWMA